MVLSKKPKKQTPPKYGTSFHLSAKSLALREILYMLDLNSGVTHKHIKFLQVSSRHINGGPHFFDYIPVEKLN